MNSNLEGGYTYGFTSGCRSDPKWTHFGLLTNFTCCIHVEGEVKFHAGLISLLSKKQKWNFTPAWKSRVSQNEPKWILILQLDVCFLNGKPTMCYRVLIYSQVPNKRALPLVNFSIFFQPPPQTLGPFSIPPPVYSALE